MIDLNFYLISENNTEIIVPNIVFPSQYTDVMDGSFDSGSFEFVLDIQSYNLYKEKELREGEFRRRELKLNNNILDNTIFIIDEINAEKDSLYSENEIKIDIKYVESTKYLTDLQLANHTYTISPIIWETLEKSKEKNSLYDVIKKSYDMLGERNNIFNLETNSYRKFVINNNLIELLRKYPNKNRTYLDVNFFDVCKENFNDISAVPYYNALNKELNYISSMGKDEGKNITNNEKKFVISSSWNRSKTNNVDAIENKAVNIYLDNDIVYVNNRPLYSSLLLPSEPIILNKHSEF